MKKIDWTKEQEKAIKKSVLHWDKDIIDYFKRGEKVKGEETWLSVWSTGKFIKDSSGYCPLCRLYAEDPFRRCSRCPYFIAYNISCDAPTGHWMKWNKQPNLRSAKNMRNALAKLIGMKCI